MKTKNFKQPLNAAYCADNDIDGPAFASARTEDAPAMQFGLNFFPCLSPAQRSAEQHFAEVLHLASLCDALGYTHVREVEHYFEPYGGYSPNPIVLLAAASRVTRKARLVTGAVLPAFNNPLKLAGEIGMLDAICGGRLDVGFARAFLPHEFERFGVSLDESRDRFTEGVEQVRLLLEQENVSHSGRFHRFSNVTSLPRPTQKPRPPFWIAALGTPQSFEEAGRRGYNLMAIPLDPHRMSELLGLYREAWRSAGHPGRGVVMNSFLMCCATDRQDALDTARAPISGHLAGLVDSASGWLTGASPVVQRGWQGGDRPVLRIGALRAPQDRIDTDGPKPEAERRDEEEREPPAPATEDRSLGGNVGLDGARLDALTLGLVVEFVVDCIEDPIEGAAGEPAEKLGDQAHVAHPSRFAAA